MQRIIGLSEISNAFDAVVTDQYGVLHDGRTRFDDAHAALEGLQRAGKPVVALTNSGKRAATNLARLEGLGFAADLFKGVVSSGELARRRLEGLPPGTTLHLISRDGETELLDGLNLTSDAEVQNPALVVMAGIRPAVTSRAEYAKALAPRAARAVPMLLVNPDTLMTEDGKTVFGPGAVARDYAQAGGPVEALGKPAPEMFRAALEALGNPKPERVLMIGDSPEHDISGARALGLQTLLVEGGVQAQLAGAPADYVIDRLQWGG